MPLSITLFTIISKHTKYSGINLTILREGLYTEDYKTLLRAIFSICAAEGHVREIFKRPK